MFINILSGIIFMFFILFYYSKLMIQKKQKIEAFKLGKGKKESSTIEIFVRICTLIWGGTWLLEVLFSEKIEKILGNIFINENIRYLGIFLNLFGLLIFSIAMITMKNSWRVGIDKDIKTEFIKHGIYKFSRNPAFVGFDLMFIGLFFTFNNLIVLLIALLNIIGLDLLIKKEEKHLEEMFGEKYKKYKKDVKRYINLNINHT